MSRLGLWPSLSARLAISPDAAAWRASTGLADPAAERVRAEMMRLARALRGTRSTVLCEAIGGSRTLEDLCELRRPLQLALANQRGELRSLRDMMRIDLMILDAWPDAPVSRPAALG